MENKRYSISIVTNFNSTLPLSEDPSSEVWYEFPGANLSFEEMKEERQRLLNAGISKEDIEVWEKVQID